MDLTIKDIEVVKNVIHPLQSVSRRFKKKTSEEAFVVSNLIVEGLRNVELISKENSDFGVLCLRVRAIFEVFLICKDIVSSNDGMKAWLYELKSDMLDVNKGMKNFSILTGNKSAAESLDYVQAYIDENVVYDAFKKKSTMRVRSERHGYLEYYDFFYKLVSKVIHPSSLLVNQRAEIESEAHYSMVWFFAAKFTEELLELALQQDQILQ